MAMVQKVADSYALTIVGGGDTDVALHKAGEYQKFFLCLHRRRRLHRTPGRQKSCGITALETWARGHPMSERRYLIAANWKMHKTLSEAKTSSGSAPWAHLGAQGGSSPGPSLHRSGRGGGRACRLRYPPLGPRYLLGAAGAYTGAISPVMLKDVGCHYVIIGHSERRQFSARPTRM